MRLVYGLVPWLVEQYWETRHRPCDLDRTTGRHFASARGRHCASARGRHLVPTPSRPYTFLTVWICHLRPQINVNIFCPVLITCQPRLGLPRLICSALFMEQIATFRIKLMILNFYLMYCLSESINIHFKLASILCENSKIEKILLEIWRFLYPWQTITFGQNQNLTNGKDTTALSIGV